MRKSHAFTIIELLVVISIISLLISLVLPLLSKARRVAKVTQCASNLRQVGIGVMAYTSDFKDYYPYRLVGNAINSNPRRMKLRSGNYDDRPMLLDYMLLDELTCPLSPATPYRVRTVNRPAVHWSYDMYFGSSISRYNPRSEMLRVTDQTEHWGQPIDVLAADMQWNYQAIGVRYSAHPADRMREHVAPSTSHATAAWINTQNNRGPVDRNFLYRDGSVTYMAGIEMNDSRMFQLPARNDQPWEANYSYIPIDRP